MIVSLFRNSEKSMFFIFVFLFEIAIPFKVKMSYILIVYILNLMVFQVVLLGHFHVFCSEIALAAKRAFIEIFTLVLVKLGSCLTRN